MRLLLLTIRSEIRDLNKNNVRLSLLAIWMIYLMMQEREWKKV
ncbi:MAG: hypothetical protein CM1200mP10_29660 [Candidatus Neomarinimicrobiota bacterium]|nr:MAG: hypothetical protein CM1200mP10_29660 [Candidatus Neomarinimicrobiota bacterium]